MQQLLLDEVAALAELPRDEVPTAVDGCGVLTFGLTLERMASLVLAAARGCTAAPASSPR